MVKEFSFIFWIPKCCVLHKPFTTLEISNEIVQRSKQVKHVLQRRQFINNTTNSWRFFRLLLTNLRRWSWFSYVITKYIEVHHHLVLEPFQTPRLKAFPYLTIFFPVRSRFKFYLMCPQFEFALIKCDLYYTDEFQCFKLLERVTLFGTAVGGVLFNFCFPVPPVFRNGMISGAFIVGWGNSSVTFFLSIARVRRTATTGSTLGFKTGFAFNLLVFSAFGIEVISAASRKLFDFGENFRRFAAGFCGLDSLAVLRFVGLGLTINWLSDSFESSSA